MRGVQSLRVGQRVEWVVESERFSELAAPWDALATAVDPLPFARHAWFSAWWRAFGTGREMRTCALWSGDELVGAFPLRARWSGLEALADVHTPVFRPLARDGPALATLLEAVLDAGPAVLHVPALPAGDPALSSLVELGARRGVLSVVEAQHTSPVVDTAGDLVEYRRHRKAGLAEYERRRRKMRREHETELVLVQRPDDLARELRHGFELEASGWKGRAGTAILARHDTARFYSDVAHAFDSLGQLRLSWIRVEGRMVAFDLALVDDRSYYLLKTAYDEGERRLAPGMVLRLSVVERCFELGLERHEFLGDDMPWKRVFSTSERQHRAFHGYRRRPDAVARYSYRRWARPPLRLARNKVRAALPAGSGRMASPTSAP